MMKTTAFIVLTFISIASAAVKRQTYSAAADFPEIFTDNPISRPYNLTRGSGLVRAILNRNILNGYCRAQVKVQVRSRSGPGQEGQKLT